MELVVRCCENGVWVVPEPREAATPTTVRTRLSFTYYETPRDVHPVAALTCCDATGNETHHGNIECALRVRALERSRAAVGSVPVDRQ